MKKLIIVESPKKVSTIKQYLPDSYNVAASVGHIRDLPEKHLGLTEQFKPIYVETKPDVINRLKSLAKSSGEVIIMTDLDREGEAIGWHLIDALGLTHYQRCATNNLNKDGVLNALANPRLIDMKQVHSQEARRVLDRLIGYRVSPLTQALLGLPSAGRVQTPALRLVVELQEMINQFNRQGYLELVLEHNYNGINFTSKLNEEDIIASGLFDDILTPESLLGEKKGKRHIQNGQFIQAIQQEIFKRGRVSVKSFEKKETKTKPHPPFTTSLLLQECSTKLGFGAKKTMATAQALFEQGYITYHRTDSTSYEPTTIQIIRDFISQWQSNLGTNYLSPTINTFKSSEGAQEGHEAIRPSNLNLDVGKITDQDQKAMYQLIFCRTIASQMAPAVYEKTDLVLNSNFQIRNHEITFVTSGRVMKFDGWKRVYKEDENTESDKSSLQILPSLMQGESVAVNNAHINKKTTKPPARYTEATLIKELEKRGIGRPSTYATIIDTLYRRSYCKLNDRYIEPLPLGFTTITHLRGNFQFADYEYTANMEAELDKIANGHSQFDLLVPKANSELDIELEAFSDKVVANLPTQPCPKCNNQSLIRKESKGTKRFNYWSCFTKHCDAFYPDIEGKPDLNYTPPTITEFKCRVCQKNLTLSKSKQAGGQQYFYCSDKSHNFIIDALEIHGKLEPNFTRWDNEHQYPCPKCRKGFLKMNKAEDKYFCSNNFAQGKGVTKCDTFIPVTEDKKPDFNSYQAEIEQFAALPNCPVCKTGKLKLTKQADKFYCTNNFNPPKGSKKCNTFVPATQDKTPDFDAYKKEIELFNQLPSCPACSTGKLKLTKGQDKFYCSNSFEKGARKCKTFIDKLPDGRPDLEGWSSSKANPNKASTNIDHRCPICSTALQRGVSRNMYTCSNGHSYEIKSDGEPNLSELHNLQNQHFI